MKRRVPIRALGASGLVLIALTPIFAILSSAQSFLGTNGHDLTNADAVTAQDAYQVYVQQVKELTGNPLRPDPLRVPITNTVALEVRDFTGVLKENLQQGTRIPIRIKVTNRTGHRLPGKVRFLLGDQTGEQAVRLAPGKIEYVNVEVCSSNLPGRWDALPLYLAFLGEECYSEGSTVFYYSRTTTNAFVKDDFVPAPGVTNPCPVTDVLVERRNESRNLYNLAVSFHWNDERSVPAVAGFTNRLGQARPTPLDFTGPVGGQPCDAVECFFDIRPDAWQGRRMANGDSEGVIRVGVYPGDGGGKPGLLYQVEPARFTNVVKLAGEVGGKCLLELKVQPGGALVGFSMQVTDHDDFNMESGRVFCLTGPPMIGHDPASFIRLGSGKPHLFYRIGY